MGFKRVTPRNIRRVHSSSNFFYIKKPLWLTNPTNHGTVELCEQTDLLLSLYMYSRALWFGVWTPLIENNIAQNNIKTVAFVNFYSDLENVKETTLRWIFNHICTGEVTSNWPPHTKPFPLRLTPKKFVINLTKPIE